MGQWGRGGGGGAGTLGKMNHPRAFPILPRTFPLAHICMSHVLVLEAVVLPAWNDLDKCWNDFGKACLRKPRINIPKPCSVPVLHFCSGIRSFISGINLWCKAWPASAILLAQKLKCHCSHPHETIAKNAQRTLVFWAGQCVQTAKAKAVWHLLIKDMIYWLRHADDGILVEICLTFAIRGPHLLGRFRKASAQALLEACGPTMHAERQE